MKLVLVCTDMERHRAPSKGKHRAPSYFELLLTPTRESIGGQIMPLAIVALAGVGVAWAFNEGLQSAQQQQTTAKNRFIYTCGSTLCQEDRIFTSRSKVTCNDALKDPRIIVDEAIHNGQNTIEIGSFIAPSQGKEDPGSAEALKRVDHVIAEAQRNDIRVILNLSDLVIGLSTSSSQEPITEWKNLVESTGRHVNTETGVTYAEDPTIMMVRLRPAAECSNEASVSNFTLDPQAAELTNAAFPMHLVES